MTEKPHSLLTHIVPPSQTTVLGPKSTPILLHHVSSKVETVEEEPYTIKCICNFADDDGNTIYCEQCDTWQHIECYYPNNIQEAYREDFAHSCVECKPRPIDRHSAIERQKLRRVKIHTTEDLSERKPKRPPTKSHKKKSKPDLQINGHSGSDTNTKQSTEQQGHKKTKSTHRSSQSISSTAKRSPSYGQRHETSHAHPPSPATTPPDIPADSEIHHYSDSFLTLYNDDRDIQIVQTNSFASLEISNVLSLWLRDHEKLQHDCGCEFKDVFQPLPPDIDAIKRTPVVSHKKQMSTPDTMLHWQYLTTPSSIEKDTPLVELNGQLGYQKDYCSDEGNQWDLLSSPLPFVFFHPELPLYIDTRREGSLARYVRRSCRPNATLETYLSGGSEYHFWLVSDRRIAPNEQITIGWDFRLERGERGRRTLQLLGLGDEEIPEQPDYDPNEVEDYQGIHTWLFQILSEHGGCACDLGSDCAFVRFYKKYINRSQTKSGNKKKTRKPKTHAISPTTTNSRAASEGHGEDGAENDSGSSHSKPPSRDMTPARQGSFDTLGILTEPTDRDKRKVAMVEDSFRRMEQQQQPPRKKKRTSDGTTSSTTWKSKRNSSGHPSSQINGIGERRYVDASTNRSMSGSPHSVTAWKHPSSRHGSIPIPSRHSSEGPRPEYCDSAVQTDPVDGEWFSPARQTPKVKRRVVSLSKRLLENRHRLRADREEQRRLSGGSPTSVTSAMVKMDLDSPKELNGRLFSPVAGKEQIKADQNGDAVMVDAAMVSPTHMRSISPTDVSTFPYVKLKSPELRVQLPPVPTFTNSATVASPATTPMSASGTFTQSPFSSSTMTSPFGPTAVNGVAVNPSPVKKKLSLSDYKSRMSKAASTKPSGSLLKAPSAIVEEAKSPTTADIHMSDSPMADKPEEPS
ncbi:phd finger and set domain-containing protein [Seiridium cupressi]